MTEGVPRVDELFSRAVVAQLAEQRAQRETFAELERRLEGLEHLVTERLTELSRLLRSGEVELRLELLEQELESRLGRLEALVTGELEHRLEAVGESIGERLGRLEAAVGSGDLARRLSALQLGVTESLGHLEERLRSSAEDVVPRLGSRLAELEGQLNDRLGALERVLGGGELSVAQRLELLEEQVVASPRVVALEAALTAGLAELAGEIRRGNLTPRLEALELAVDENSSRFGELARTSEVEHRLETLHQSLEHRLDGLSAELAAPSPAVPDEKLAALDEAVNRRLTGLEGSLRELEGALGAKLEELAEAHTAAEAGILERIIAESQVVAAHFQAVRPVVEGMATAGPELQAALEELRRLAETARATPTDHLSYLAAGLDHNGEGDDEADTVFLPPEETPIPDRRFGGILPRRERSG